MISLGGNIQSSWMGSESWKSSRSLAGIIKAFKKRASDACDLFQNLSMVVHGTVKIGIMRG